MYASLARLPFISSLYKDPVSLLNPDIIHIREVTLYIAVCQFTALHFFSVDKQCNDNTSAGISSLSQIWLIILDAEVYHTRLRSTESHRRRLCGSCLDRCRNQSVYIVSIS